MDLPRPPAPASDPIHGLAQVPLFAALPEAELQALAARLRPLTFPAGAYLVREGERGDQFYLILEGELEPLYRALLEAEVQA